jgi:hypothetical protein
VKPTVNVEVTSVTVIRFKSGDDSVLLKTTLPGGLWSGVAIATIAAKRGTGELYASTNFPGIPVDVIGKLS